MTDAAYNKAYLRGWRSTAASAVDRADARNEPEAWYDGYFDAGAGRDKFHSRECREGKIECKEHVW